MFNWRTLARCKGIQNTFYNEKSLKVFQTGSREKQWVKQKKATGASTVKID